MSQAWFDMIVWVMVGGTALIFTILAVYPVVFSLMNVLDEWLCLRKSRMG